MKLVRIRYDIRNGEMLNYPDYIVFDVEGDDVKESAALVQKEVRGGEIVNIPAYFFVYERNTYGVLNLNEEGWTLLKQGLHHFDVRDERGSRISAYQLSQGVEVTKPDGTKLPAVTSDAAFMAAWNQNAGLVAQYGAIGAHGAPMNYIQLDATKPRITSLTASKPSTAKRLIGFAEINWQSGLGEYYFEYEWWYHAGSNGADFLALPAQPEGFYPVQVMHEDKSAYFVATSPADLVAKWNAHAPNIALLGKLRELPNRIISFELEYEGQPTDWHIRIVYGSFHFQPDPPSPTIGRWRENGVGSATWDGQPDTPANASDSTGFQLNGVAEFANPAGSPNAGVVTDWP